MPDTVVMFLAQSLAAFLKQVGQQQVVLVGPTGGPVERPPLLDVLEDMLKLVGGPEITQTVRIDEQDWDDVYDTVSMVRTPVRCEPRVGSRPDS